MAMPNHVKMFPRGYSGGQSRAKPVHSNREGDPEITALWKQYCEPVNNSTSWQFRRLVLGCAKRLLGGRPNWFLSQDPNPWVLAYNYQFVIDTLRFIGTGRRRISIHAWPDLLSNYPKNELPDVSNRHEIADTFTQLALTTSIDALLQLWCSHPKGFDDMICTLNLLFGDHPLKIESDPNA
jgi:hypothetical protein